MLKRVDTQSTREDADVASHDGSLYVFFSLLLCVVLFTASNLSFPNLAEKKFTKRSFGSTAQNTSPELCSFIYEQRVILRSLPLFCLPHPIQQDGPVTIFQQKRSSSYGASGLPTLKSIKTGPLPRPAGSGPGLFADFPHFSFPLLSGVDKGGEKIRISKAFPGLRV